MGAGRPAPCLSGSIEPRRFPCCPGTLSLAIWLIATGLLPLSKGRLPHSATVLNVLAVVAGLLILLGR